MVLCFADRILPQKPSRCCWTLPALRERERVELPVKVGLDLKKGSLVKAKFIRVKMILPGLNVFYNRYRTLASTLIICSTKLVDFVGLQAYQPLGSLC